MELFQGMPNETEYKQMVMNVLDTDESDIAQKLLHCLEKDGSSDETDRLTREISHTVPYNILMPYLRHILGLDITTDTDCISALNNLGKYFGSDSEETAIIQNCINFLHGQEVDFPPSLDLKILLGNLPLEMYPEVERICDFLSKIETTEEC